MQSNKIFSILEQKEIWIHLINSALAGALVFLGAFSAGKIDTTTCIMAATASLIVFVSKFKEFFEGKFGKIGSIKLFSFVGV